MYSNLDDIDKITIKNIIDCYEEQIVSLKKRLSILEDENIRQNAILWGTNAGTWVWNLIENSLSINDRYLEILGYTKNELLVEKPEDCKKLIHPEDIIKIDYEMQSHFSNKKDSLECEFRMLHKSGKWVWVLSKGKVTKRNENGEPILMAGMHIDITAIKNLQEKYDANLALWHSAFDSHTSVMLLIEPISGKIIDANYSASKFYGYSIDELKRMKISEINTLSKEQVEQERIKAFNSERNYFIFPHKLSSGEIRIVEVNSSNVFIDGQKLLFSIIHDITDRKLAEENLKLNEEKYRTILQTALDGFLIIDELGNIIEANESYSEMIGYSIEELKKLNVLDISAVYDLKSLNEKLTLLKGTNSNKYITKHRCKDGKVLDVEISVKYQEINNRIIFIVFVSDISEKIIAANQIRLMKENYERFLNSIDEFLFVFDELGNILFINSEVTKRLGYFSEDIFTNNKHIKNICEVYNIDSLENVINGQVLPSSLCTKFNEKINVETRVFKGLWNNDPVFFGLSKDITQVLISEEKFSKVFKLNPVACGISEPITGNYLEVNDAFCKLFEFDEKEIIGKNAIQLGILDEKVKEEIIKVFQLQGKLRNYETMLYSKTKKPKHVLLSVDNVVVYNRNVRFTVASDITDLKDTHIRLSNANKELLDSKILIEQVLNEKEIIIKQLNETKNNLEKTNSEKDKLFSIISHDLKSPFQGFLGLTEVLANDSEVLSSEEMKDLFLQFNVTTKRLYNLLSNLLDWSKMKGGIINFEPKYVDISKIVKQNITLLEQNKKNIILINKINENSFLYIDEKMINSVIRNLITNAIKFSSLNSTIVIDLQKCSDGYDIISIQDKGIGIPEGILSKLFVIGEKVGRTGTLGEESTGLGLLLCKEFIEKHKGKIWVESKINIGSTFYFSVPNTDVFN